MANITTARSHMEISEDIASVLERVDPGAYPDTEHANTVNYVTRVLYGRSFMTPDSFLSSIHRQAHQRGLSEEMNPLVKEARILLGIPLRRKKQRTSQTEIGR